MRAQELHDGDGTIAAIADQLRWETHPTLHEGLKTLLLKELHRFGTIEEPLEMVEGNINRSAELIARQKRLIEEITISGGDTKKAEHVLQNFENVHALFENFRTLTLTRREQQGF